MSALSILAFGDSLIAGYGLAPSESFTARLEALLQGTHTGAKVINAGISGDTSGAALARLPRVLSQLKVRPDLAIVQLGANDLLTGVPLTTTRTNLDIIVAELMRAGIPVLLATIEAPAWFGSFGQACAAVYADLAGKHGIRCAPFFPKGVFANPAYCLHDRVHPNTSGTDAIARGFLPAVLSALASRQDAPLRAAAISTTGYAAIVRPTVDGRSMMIGLRGISAVAGGVATLLVIGRIASMRRSASLDLRCADLRDSPAAAVAAPDR